MHAANWVRNQIQGFAFSFLCGMMCLCLENSEGLWWLPSSILGFYLAWLRMSCFLIGKIEKAFTWREGRCFKDSPALRSWLDSWSHPWSPVPTPPLGIAFRVLATVLSTTSKDSASLTWWRIEMNRIQSKSNTKSCNFYVPVRLKTFSVYWMVDPLSHGISSF